MSTRWGIAAVCPGCGIPLVAGALADAFLQAVVSQQRVLGLIPGVTADDCQAVYVGDCIVNGILPCPRCGANCCVKPASP